MHKGTISVLALGTLLMCSLAFAQEATTTIREKRHPEQTAQPSTASTPAPSGDFFFLLNGSPMLLALHHDTEVGTNKPIDVYDFVIEMQVMNSDGNFEPVGLQIHNFYTAKPLDAANDVNPNTACDCKTWYKIISFQQQHHNRKNVIWPYVQFKTAEGARVVQTNEHGAVWWSDDIECWGSQDRFPPF
jgi:hypothetical protein